MSTSPETAGSDEVRARREQTIRCARCSRELTHPAQAIAERGAHEHTFFNPAGVVFTIRCFGDAKGARTLGERTTEFTWFPGWAWRIAACAACGAHVGWRWERGESGFFGLITVAILDD